jgi:manganese-dependent inorganic pyrophosphatase
MAIKVIGHKAPDTDTVCSAIAYSWLLNKKGINSVSCRAGELNKETKYVLEKFGVNEPILLEEFSSEDEVIIVDTNNKDELPSGIENTQIKEIIDHHKLTGTISTNEPIPIIIKPWASTASIIWKHIKHSGYIIDNKIAGILLAAVLSDTLKFNSPTTTKKDIESAKELEKEANTKMDPLAEEMFAAKSDLSGMTAKDILLVDSKVFDFSSRKTRMSVLETTSPENALSMKKELLAASIELKKDEKTDYLFFFVVDIIRSESSLIVSTNEEMEIAQKAFGKEFKDNFMKLEKVVSRKKQMIPAIEKALSK